MTDGAITALERAAALSWARSYLGYEPPWYDHEIARWYAESVEGRRLRAQLRGDDFDPDQCGVVRTA
jgi:hypothetical protein